MKKKALLFCSHIVVATAASCLTLVSLHFLGIPGQSKLEQLSGLIQEKHIEDVDVTAMEDAAAVAMVESAGDRWSYYIPAAEYQAYREQAENAYVGVGITIQAVEENAGFSVVDVNEKGPAFEAGILPGDLFIAVEDQDIRSMTTEGVRELVRGEEGTYVKLTILRDGEHRTISVERRQVLTDVATFEMLPDNVGLVTIVNFDDRCAQESIRAIETLRENGATRLIFDVRHNPGGFASEMVELLDYLLPEGDLFRMVSYKGEESVDRSDAECLQIPMVVLVNSGSYSAAEFFAAALQEYEAATVVGQKTSGKGLYQNTFLLSDGSAVALSVGKYFTPKGVSLEGVGILPDIQVEVDDETAAAIYYGTLDSMDDPYIREAMEILKDK